MRTLIVAIGLFVSCMAFSVINVGDPVPDKCYSTEGNGKFCLSYAVGAIKVIVNNAGWCAPCNDELHELSIEVPKEFSPMLVTVISASAEDFNHELPSQEFLTAWKNKHNIPFIVAADPENFGKDYFSQPRIPNVAIIDQNNNLYWKKIGPEVSEVIAKVKELR